MTTTRLHCVGASRRRCYSYVNSVANPWIIARGGRIVAIRSTPRTNKAPTIITSHVDCEYVLRQIPSSRFARAGDVLHKSLGSEHASGEDIDNEKCRDASPIRHTLPGVFREISQRLSQSRTPGSSCAQLGPSTLGLRLGVPVGRDALMIYNKYLATFFAAPFLGRDMIAAHPSDREFKS